MLSTRQILASTFVLALLPVTALRGASDSVEYVSGTVKSIPVNTVGSLGLGDSKELRFTYGRNVYKLPYDQITATNVTDAQPHRLLGKLKVPSMGHKKAILAVSFRDNDDTGTLTFELPADRAHLLRKTIADRTTPKADAPVQLAAATGAPEASQASSPAPTQAAAPATNAAQPKPWWGDNYWKTMRNKPQWDAKNPTVNPVPTAVGTK